MGGRSRLAGCRLSLEPREKLQPLLAPEIARVIPAAAILGIRLLILVDLSLYGDFAVAPLRRRYLWRRFCFTEESIMRTPPLTATWCSSQGRVIVVGNDRRKASGTAQWLCGLGWHASAAGNAAEAMHFFSRETCDACVIDASVAAHSVASLVASLRATSPSSGIVMVAVSRASIALVRDRLDLGFDAVVTTRGRGDDFVRAIQKACGNRLSRGSAPEALPLLSNTLLGSHRAIEQVLDVVSRISHTTATVLISGESGTGKSLVAREIHKLSRRRRGRFVEVACGSLSESLLESELFGHVAGAFTGATVNRDGKFLQADGGTIFLDETATASPSMQVKLLRVLQDLHFEPVGGGHTHAVDARIILATHENLEQRVAAGTFRADLFWRINVITIEMPALRNRASDIPLLATHFLTAAIEKAGRHVKGFTTSAMNALLSHEWPGNVRELEHAVERAVFLGRGSVIDICDLPPGVAVGSAVLGAAPRDQLRVSLKSAMAQPERQLIIDALDRHGWRRDAAARSLGINRTTLYKKVKRLGMNLAALEPNLELNLEPNS